MVGYILLVILTIGGWALLCIGFEKDNDCAVAAGVVFAVLFTVPFMITSIKLGTKHSDAVSFENDRNYQQELIYSISDTMSPQTINKIIDKATYINEKIERNKRHCDSKMWGFMYNKEIAEVEPIGIPKLKYQIMIEENASEE